MIVMGYACGTCGSTTLLIRPSDPPVGFDIFCENGHQAVPVPGQELVIKTGQMERI